MRFEKKKQARLKRYFYGIHITDKSINYWYNMDLKKWMPDEEVDYSKHSVSNEQPCKTIRAFRRHLRKNPILKGKCVLVNKYKNFDVYA